MFNFLKKKKWAKRIAIIKDDITTLNVDAIVNAANPYLTAGHGVCGAIHKAAGPRLTEYCSLRLEKTGRIMPGQATITMASGNLLCDYVIHAVGPDCRACKDMAITNGLLYMTYCSIMALCLSYNLQSVAIPCISTGIYSFPKDKAAKIAMDAVKTWINKHAFPDKVIFCCFEEEDYKLYKAQL